MAKLLKLRRGTTSQHGSFTGAEGEVTIDTTKDTAVVHDGSQTGGRPLAREDLSNVSANNVRDLVENASNSNTFNDADHTKLNGIETAATQDQTASEILTLIKTVDGSSSGLDADILDGLDSSQFLRSDADDTVNATLTTRRINVQGNYDIRLAGGNWTGDTAAKIQQHNGHFYLQYPDSGTFKVRDSAGNDNFTVDSSGNATAVGNVTAYSDRRLKTDIHTINDALGICGKLRGVSYKWIRDGKPSIGVIAQEIEEVIPEVVLTSQDLNPSTGESIEVKSVDYGKIVGVLINAINELKAEVDELKGGK